MVSLSALWLPILLSGVAVFIASFLMWMVMPHHKSDWKRLPKEDAALEGLRAAEVSPGQYTFPYALPSEMKDPEIQKKLDQGPVGLLVVGANGPPAIGKSLVLSFVWNIVIAVFVAYLAASTLDAGADYLAVFRVVGTAAILGYAGSTVMGAIWFSRTWSSVLKEVFDGVVYGLLTAGVFGWLWP